MATAEQQHAFRMKTHNLISNSRGKKEKGRCIGHFGHTLLPEMHFIFWSYHTFYKVCIRVKIAFAFATFHSTNILFKVGQRVKNE